MDTFAIVPPPHNGEGFVELSRSKQGRVFEKHILNYGDLLYPKAPGGKVAIDDKFADTLIANFSNKVCDIVQVPKAGPNNEHTEDPDRNIGEVIGLVKRNNKVYAQIDARNEADADKLGKTLLGASAMMHLNYQDTRTGERVGPTLLHVAVTNRPYVVGLEEYSEVIAASADGSSEAVFLTASTKRTNPMDLDEILGTLKADHGIDVPALQAKAADADTALALSNTIQEELVGTGILKLSNSAGEDITLVQAVTALGEQNVALSNELGTIKETAKTDSANARVEALVKSGHILPVKKAASVTLLLSNPSLFEELLPSKPIIKLSADGEEKGFETVDLSHDTTVSGEVERLAKTYAKAPK